MNELLETALRLKGKLVYKKLKNRYRIYCMKCRRYEYVSKEKFKQIQAAQICPMCYRDVEFSRVLEHQFQYYIANEDNDGYRVTVDYRFGCKPKASFNHVMYDALDGTNVYVRHIFCNMGTGFCWNDKMTTWKKRNGQAYYYRFYSSWERSYPKSKKEYIYTALYDRGYTNHEIDKTVKSNQKKIFMDNLMSGAQMEFAIAFDLKSYDEMYKYRSYIRNNRANIHKPLNIYYLDYLYRNEIKLRDFYDYMKQCEKLGLKVEKPKDFQKKHIELGEIIARMKDKEYEDAVKRRYAELMKKAYSVGSIQIVPFKDAAEIRECGKQLHNCIASVYLKEYAQYQTDLYCLKKKGEITVAIEVLEGRLEQARINWNKECPPDLMKHIRKWCKANEFEVAI